jgi:hypothetical protein
VSPAGFHRENAGEKEGLYVTAEIRALVFDVYRQVPVSSAEMVDTCNLDCTFPGSTSYPATMTKAKKTRLASRDTVLFDNLLFTQLLVRRSRCEGCCCHSRGSSTGPKMQPTPANAGSADMADTKIEDETA